MPQERLTMRKIREILRLKWELQLSERIIARSCCTSRSTVADYIRRAAAAGLTWPLPENQSDSQLSELLYPKTQEPTLKATFLPDWEETHLELRRKGVTLRLLWVEYLEKYPQGYGYNQYCQLYLIFQQRHFHKTPANRCYFPTFI
jgi:transposase